ncbi:MAG: thrombospondin type 3 repeat-containing protein [Saprospiraceae bacterium]
MKKLLLILFINIELSSYLCGQESNVYLKSAESLIEDYYSKLDILHDLSNPLEYSQTLLVKNSIQTELLLSNNKTVLLDNITGATFSVNFMKGDAYLDKYITNYQNKFISHELRKLRNGKLSKKEQTNERLCQLIYEVTVYEIDSGAKIKIRVDSIIHFIIFKRENNIDLSDFARIQSNNRYFLDSDDDSIPDKIDVCPYIFGSTNTMGCPDQDEDGIPDKDDSCPIEKGGLATNGCPDQDGDGVPDKDDKCPNEFGLINSSGCPDQDADGIYDKEDDCPNVAGLLNGCPDSDNDGFPDYKDECPNEKGIQYGCPDSDADGIPDYKDKCPNRKGNIEYNGCPVLRQNQILKIPLLVRLNKRDSIEVVLKNEIWDSDLNFILLDNDTKVLFKLVTFENKWSKINMLKIYLNGFNLNNIEKVNFHEIVIQINNINELPIELILEINLMSDARFYETLKKKFTLN